MECLLNESAAHRHTDEQIDLGEQLLSCAFRGSIEELHQTYVAGGLAQNYAARADILVLMAWVTRMSLNFGLRQILRIRRTPDDRDRLLATAVDGAPASVIDPVQARELLDWACKLAAEPLKFQIDDRTCQTYVAVAAAALMYTVGPDNAIWKRRYLAIARAARRRRGVRAEHRIPPGGW